LSFLGRLSLEFEAKNRNNKQRELKFADSKKAWQIYLKLRTIFLLNTPVKIETCLKQFFRASSFGQWKGATLLKEKCDSLFPKHGITEKSLDIFKTKVYRAWRAVIRYYRKELEELKSGFKDAKYLVIMNPINMDKFEKKELRKALAKFPWLRTIRRIMTKFYYQFRVSPAKRCSLKFLLNLVSNNSHAWLKSAVDTLIKCEDQIFRFQVLYKKYPELKNIKAIKVVDESTMRKINKIYP
jgi:hypothetical protein